MGSSFAVFRASSSALWWNPVYAPKEISMAFFNPTGFFNLQALLYACFKFNVFDGENGVNW